MHNAPTINAQNIDDNECFNWCLVQYLHPADHHLARIRKVDKKKEKDFKDTKYPFKIRNSHKIEKKNCLSISDFVSESKERRRKQKVLCTYQRF